MSPSYFRYMMRIVLSWALLLSVSQALSFPSNTDRRHFLARVAASAISTVSAPAWAVQGQKKVNSKLQSYGLPPTKVPDGFTSVAEIYGKGVNRFPILVTFAYPVTWVLTLPSNDVNGEDGTVQAGEYAKGDTATFFVYEEPGHVSDLASQPKDMFEQALQKCISQKGVNMYQNFKVTKLEPSKTEDGSTYMLADFKYQLLTGAGFEVDRKGVAAITSQGKAVEVLWAASTTQRWKKTEGQLRDIVSSFRCYTDGLNMSDELITFD